MSQRIALAGLLSFTLALNGCALFPKKKRPEPVAAQQNQQNQPHAIGTVALVNNDLHFVLIDVGSSYEPLKGVAVKSFTDGQESGILTISGERQRPFVAADIVKGAPQKGDTVLQ